MKKFQLNEENVDIIGFFLIKNLLIFFVPQRDEHNEAILHSSLSMNIKHGHHLKLCKYEQN